MRTRNLFMTGCGLALLAGSLSIGEPPGPALDKPDATKWDFLCEAALELDPSLPPTADVPEIL